MLFYWKSIGDLRKTDIGLRAGDFARNCHRGKLKVLTKMLHEGPFRIAPTAEKETESAEAGTLIVTQFGFGFPGGD